MIRFGSGRREWKRQDVLHHLVGPICHSDVQDRVSIILYRYLRHPESRPPELCISLEAHLAVL
jgi:hypothetical protein